MSESPKDVTDPFAGLPEEIVATYRDPITGALSVFHRDIVWRQMTRESPRLAEEFDRTFKTDVDEISHEYAIATGILQIGVENASREPRIEVKLRCAAILQN